MLETIIDIDTDLLLAINSASSPFADSFMWNYSRMAVWIPLILTLIYVVVRNNKWKDTALILACFALAFLIADQISSSFFKPTFQRLRPTHNPELMELVRVVNDYRGGQYGFVSGHAANSFAAVTFVALLIRNWKVTLPLTLWALVNCWSRMYLGVHYPTDILCGALVGVFSGLVAYYLFNLAEKSIMKHNYKVVYNYANLINIVLLISVSVLLILATVDVYI